jgi:phosphatidylglycerophosphatase C
VPRLFIWVLEDAISSTRRESLRVPAARRPTLASSHSVQAGIDWYLRCQLVRPVLTFANYDEKQSRSAAELSLPPPGHAAKIAPMPATPSATPGSNQIAVFDLDGTLLAGDSTIAWLRMLLLSSWVRCIAAALIAPACLLLLWFPASRRIGASILLWIATWGYDQNAIALSIEAFAKRFESGEPALRWRNDGLAAMDRHRAAGDLVLVVTAAPVWLAQRLLAIRTGIPVLGSTLVRRWGGWILEHHCHGQKKCGMLEQSGYGTAWDYAYTDSYDDAPLLIAARKRGFIVNGRRGVVDRLAARGQSRISTLRWT